MLALAEYRRNHCDNCAGPLSETTDGANEFEYEPVGPLICWKCAKVGAAQHSYAGENNHRPWMIHATRWSARLKSSGG